MIIPEFWAEARLQQRTRKRQVTVRRFGWSDASQAEAQAHADARVREAFDRVLAGEPLLRRERRIAYNGAEGMPIREQIVSRHGATMITRNGYGALCLNTPDVLFADIDFERDPGGRLVLFTMLALLPMAIALGVVLSSWKIGAVAVALALILGYPIARQLQRAAISLQGGDEARARKRIAAFTRRHSDWHLRVYRTPAGLRVLAMHRTFDPRDPAVEACFRALGVDRVYARMCHNQNCFRARVSPKPWRIGISRHIRPRYAAWNAEHAELAERRQWIGDYEHVAHKYAACRFIEATGSKKVDIDAEAVQRLHDDLCQATRSLPIA